MAAFPVLVAAPVIGLALACAAHFVWARWSSRPSPYPPLVGGIFAGLVGTAVVTAGALSAMQPAAIDVLGYAVLNLTTYGALGWCYFHFVNLCIASLRIRVLEEIVDAGGNLDQALLVERYGDRGLVEVRLQRLTSGGHLVFREQRYYSGKLSFLLIARLFELLRRGILGTKPPRRSP